jgi:hypothetical protein
MQFLKKHYEKVLLSIVLLGLAAAAAALPLQVSSERGRLEEIQRNLTVKVKAKPFKPMDDWTGTNKAALGRLENSLNVELSGAHNLFNPVQWKKVGDRFIPIRRGTEMGPGAVKISLIKELSLTVSFEGVDPGTSGEPPKYKVNVKRDMEGSPKGDTRWVSTATPHLNVFDLINIQGPTNEPTALVLKLKDNIEAITVPKDKPYSHVIGYSADMVYPTPSGKQQPFKDKKVNDTVKLEDDPETYKIVAITRNEVVLSADSNKRRWVIKYSSSNATASAK